MTTTDHFTWRYEHWLKHPKVLDGRYRHRIVSINETSTGLSFSNEEINDKNIPSLCEHQTLPNTKWSLQILLTRPGWSCRDQEIVPYSLAAVEALCSFWRIPYNYVPKLHSAGAMAFAFSPVQDDHSWKGLCQILPTTAGSTLVVAYNATTHQTFGVCVDISDENIDRLIHRLELSQNFASNPLLVPVVLESFVAHFLQHRTAKTYSFYLDQEEHMQIDKEHEHDSKPYKPWSREDDSSTSQRLTEVAIVTAELDAGITSMSRILDCVERELQALSKAFNPSSKTEIQEQINFLRQRLASTHSYTSQIREKVQFLVQLVYAAQQQEDNQVNHRYGADMRLITAITLIFLPATFVATFFSTSFWDFAPGNKGAKVSRWVWLYAVVTIGLTLMVLGIWLNFDALVGLPVTVRKLLFGTMWKFTREQRKELKEAMELEKRRRREH